MLVVNLISDHSLQGVNLRHRLAQRLRQQFRRLRTHFWPFGNEPSNLVVNRLIFKFTYIRETTLVLQLPVGNRGVRFVVIRVIRGFWERVIRKGSKQRVHVIYSQFSLRIDQMAGAL